MLHLVQSVEGRVTPEGIEACADILDLSAAEVSGVATFYTMYKRRPVGDYHVGVCTNTLCAVMGGDAIFAAPQGAPRRRQRRDHGRRQGDPRARRVQRRLRLRPGDDGELGVHGQHDAPVGHAAGRRPARGQGGALDAWSADRHLARGRAGARRLPRRPRRRGSRGRAGLAGRPRHRAQDRGWTAPDGGDTRALGSRGQLDRHSTALDRHSATEAAEQADTSRAESETKQEEGHQDG